jgi:hypothetical protein
MSLVLAECKRLHIYAVTLRADTHTHTYTHLQVTPHDCVCPEAYCIRNNAFIKARDLGSLAAVVSVVSHDLKVSNWQGQTIQFRNVDLKVGQYREGRRKGYAYHV